jgi:hypothetical protein
MACNISKHSNKSSNFSGSLAKMGFYFGFLAIEFSGSGLFVNTFTADNG